jgi:hypothetical protein
VDESGITTQPGSIIDNKMVAVHEVLCTIPPRNSNQYKTPFSKPILILLPIYA